MVSEFLSEEATRKRGLFSWPAVQQLLADHSAERKDYTDQLFSLVMLELWLQAFLDRQPHEWVAEPLACQATDPPN